MTGLTANPTGLVGAWATVGTGAARRYAGINGAGVISAFTGTAAGSAANLTDTTGLVNYELSAPGGTMPATVSANTIRYTGFAGTTNLGATLFSVNGLMNVGSGTWTINSNTLTIGASRELIVHPSNQSIIIGSVIADNPAGPSALTTYTGTGSTVLTGANTYTGPTTLLGALGLGNSTTTGSISPRSTIVIPAFAVQLRFGRTNTITRGLDFPSAISGVGPVGQVDSGNVVLLGGNTYTGATGVSPTGTTTATTLADGGLPSSIGAAGNSSTNLTSPALCGTREPPSAPIATS